MPSLTKSAKSKSKLLVKQLKQLKKLAKVVKSLKNGHKNGVKTSFAAPKTGAKTGKRVYFFGGGKSDGNKEMKNLLGGKGANLAEMANIGLPVPPGFTITTEVCTEFYANGKKLPKQLDGDVRAMIARMEKAVGAKFGDPSNPLLVSVR